MTTITKPNTMTRNEGDETSRLGQMLNKVPEVTLYFWIIKVLCTTVGETAADYLNAKLNFGLTNTTCLTGALLLVVLLLQFMFRRYVPAIYWLAVVLISVVGTLITDNLTDNFGVSLVTTTIVFAIALAATFAAWFASEKTLSIHSIVTRKREAFYWLAILFTFALGTAAGDLTAEEYGVGYLPSAFLFAGLIALVTIAHYALRAARPADNARRNAILAFWIAYILTRPLGASLGDYVSQAPVDGGLGLGTVITSAMFLSAISITVLYLTFTKKDSAVPTKGRRDSATGAMAIVVSALVIAGGSGYYVYQMKLRSAAPAASSPASPLGDLSRFRQIAEDTLGLVRSANLPAAQSRISDLESAWDKAEPRLKPMNPAQWTSVDSAIDKALKSLRSRQPDSRACSTTLESLIGVLNAIDKGKPM
jgi:uncharacterized membrane-anchored protein